MNPDVVILIVLIALSAVFSGSETAMISLSKSRVDALVVKRVGNSRVLQKLKSNPHKLLITVLIGNNIVNTAAAALAAVILTEKFGSSGVGIATGVMTFLLLVFGEITPKSFCHQHAIKVSLFMARPIYILQLIFTPFVWFFGKIVDGVNKIFGTKKMTTVTEGELIAMLKIGTEEGTIEKQEREFIENVLEFNDIKVEDVMTPRVAIEALDNEMTIQEAVDYVIKHSHTRMPVYEKDLDHIIGVLPVKDLLKYFDAHSTNKKIKNLKLVNPLEVPYSKKINQLFREFQRKHLHMAIVIDEFGGTAGIVTMEDLIEEIVGEIEDESDNLELPIEVIDERTIVAKGSAVMEDINDHLRINFWRDEKDSVNTMLVEHLGRFPREGESVRFPNGRVVVQKMKKNVVQKVKITKFKRKVK